MLIYYEYQFLYIYVYFGIFYNSKFREGIYEWKNKEKICGIYVGSVIYYLFNLDD